MNDADDHDGYDELREALEDVAELDPIEEVQFMRRLQHWIDAMAADEAEARAASERITRLH